MKIIFLLLSLLVNIAYAQSHVKNLLLDGDTQKIRQAAKIMTSGEQNTLENLRLLATIIEQEFESAPSSRIDALSWGCRALAATGDSQYNPLLKKVYQSQVTHRKLRKYAKRAYQELALLPPNPAKNKGNILLPTGLPTNISRDFIPKASLLASERKTFAIAKGDWQAIKFIAQQLTDLEKPDTKLLDALSQFLIENYVHNLDNEQIDVLAWICRALGQSNNSRYKTILEIVAKHTTNQKLKNYAISASNKLTNTAIPYVINSISFQEILDDFKQN
jgi:hypothetical protein